MSSFNNVAKISYKDNQDAIVSLLEYILFENTKLGKKYIVFKFNNNLNQILKAIRFEVSGFDKDGDLIEKTILDYDKFEAKPGASFVPNAKLPIDFDCTSIKVKLLYAEFERLAWNNGEYEPIQYSIEEFRSDFATKEEKKSSKKIIKLEKMADKRQAKFDKKLEKKRQFTAREVISSNRTNAPKVVTILLTIFLAIFIGVSIFYFNRSNLQFYENGFQYEVSQNGARIVDYDNDNKNVIIPAKALDYDVIAIDKNVFSGEDIESIKFEGRISILDMAFKNCYNLRVIYGAENIARVGDYAFQNCKDLRELDLENVSYIGRGAFEGCDNLRIVEAANAIASKASFKDCYNVSSLTLKDVEEFSKCRDIFDGKVPNGFSELSIGTKEITKDFFLDMENVNVTLLNEKEASFEYGALKYLNLPNYVITDSFELYNDHIISINKEVEVFHLPSYLSNLDEDLTNFDLGAITALKIDPQKDPITSELLSYFYNLKTLYYNPSTDYLENALDEVRVDTIVLDSNDSFVNGVDVRMDNVENLVIEGNGVISSTMFNYNCLDFSKITNLVIKESTEIERGALSQLTGLVSLKMPTNKFNFNDLGVRSGIENIYLTASNVTTIPNNFLVDYNMLGEITLPNNIITIGDNFISNCLNLMRIKLPSSLEYIGDNFVADCRNIDNIVFPSSLKGIGSNILYNTSVYELNLPDNIMNIKAPILKQGSSVSSIKVPFISTSSYMSFNEDYRNTNSLTITGDIKLTNETFEDMTYLSSLSLLGETTGLSKGVFEGLKYLRNLQVSGSTNCSFSELFNKDTVVLDRLVISSAKLGNQFFANCTIGTLVIAKADDLDVKLFMDCTRIISIYIPSDIQRNVIEYKYLKGKTYNIFSDKKLGEDDMETLNQLGISFEIIKLEDFLN